MSDLRTVTHEAYFEKLELGDPPHVRYRIKSRVRPLIRSVPVRDRRLIEAAAAAPEGALVRMTEVTDWGTQDLDSEVTGFEVLEPALARA